MEAPPPDLSVAALMLEAAERSGSDEWGDRGFVEAFELLVRSSREGEALTPVGLRVLRSVALRHLGNRLLIEAFARQNPSVRDRALGPSIVVTGLPRTGTTVLHQLLALDPRNRVLRLWEALRPVPPRDEAERSRRIARAREWLERFYEGVPSFRDVHPLSPEGPEECDALLQNSFASQHFDDMFDAPEYSAWLYAADLTREYEHYALQLRVLASSDPPTAGWVLKSPSHLAHLGALLRALPDALIVHCHRDPAEAVASYARLIATLRRAYSEGVSTRAIGRQALTRTAAAMGRALEARDAAGADRFVDLAHGTIVGDPIEAVRRVYERAGRGLAPAAETRMREWVARHLREPSPGDPSALAALGLTEEEVNAAFEAYADRFPTPGAVTGAEGGRWR